jgi:hypothetical protein
MFLNLIREIASIIFPQERLLQNCRPLGAVRFVVLRLLSSRIWGLWVKHLAFKKISATVWVLIS